MKIITLAEIFTGILATAMLLGCFVGRILKKLDKTAIPDRRE